jgi:hypothetical protein
MNCVLIWNQFKCELDSKYFVFGYIIFLNVFSNDFW